MTKSSNYNHAHQQSPQTSYPQQQTQQHAPPSYTSGKDSVTMKPRHSPSFVEMASDDTLSVETFRSPTSPRRRHQHSRFRRSASGSSFFDCDSHGNVRSPVEVYRDDESPADLSDTSSDEFSGLRATPPLCGDSGESSASPVTSHVNSPMVGAVRRVPNSCVENHCSVKPCSPPRASSDDGVWKAYENEKEVQCKPMMSKEQIEHMERTNLLGVLACIIEQLCPANEVLPTDPHYLSLFHTSAIPSISIRDYLFRLASYTSVSSECLIQTVIHIQNLSRRGRAEVAAAAASASGLASPTSHISRQRSYSTTSSAQSSSLSSPSSALSHSNAFNEALLTQSAADLARPHPRINSFSNQPFQVCIHNIHRLLLTAILVTAKFVDDAFYNNRIYSTLGGVSVRELNRLECEFLAITDYRLMITAQEFQREWELMNHPMRHGAWCMQPNHPCGPVMAIDSGYDESLDDDLDEMFVSTPSSSRTSSVSTPIGSPSAAHRRATSDAIMQCGSHCSSTAMTPVESPRQQQRPQRHHQHSYSLSHHPLHVKVAPISSDQSSDAYCTQTRRFVPSVPSSTSASSKPFSVSHLA